MKKWAASITSCFTFMSSLYGCLDPFYPSEHHQMDCVGSEPVGLVNIEKKLDAHTRQRGITTGCVLQDYSSMKFSVNLAQRKVTLFIGNKSYLGRIVTNQYQDSLEALLYSTQKSIVLQQKTPYGVDPNQRIVITFKGIRAYMSRQGSVVCDKSPTMASVTFLDENHVELKPVSGTLHMILFVTKDGPELSFEPLGSYDSRFGGQLLSPYAFLGYVPTEMSLGCKPWSNMLHPL